MKLVLKDGNEINITRANNMYSYDNLKDGLGCDLNKNVVSSIIIFNPDKPFEEIREILAGDNREGFKIIYGNTEKDYAGMKIETVSEEIANERSIITIELGIIEGTTVNTATGTTSSTTSDTKVEKESETKSKE